MEHTHYYCEDCGNVFLIEEANSITFDYGVFDGCPRCKGISLTEASICKECENVLTEQEHGCILCKECLFDLVDYQIGYEYITSNKDLPMFMFEYVLGVKEPEKVNELLMNEIKMMFERKKVEDILYNKPLLLDKIKEYIENDLWHFSDYLKEKGVI